MKKTQKIAALACAGMVAAGIAALPISAATTNNGNTEVKYIAGTVSTDDQNRGNHLVALPADVIFVKDSAEQVDFDISLITKNGNNFLDDVNVEVKAHTKNGLKLKNDMVPGIEGTYSVVWGAAGAEKRLTETATTAATAVEAVTFTKANFSTIDTKNIETQTGNLTLPNTEMQKLEKAKKGTVLKDTVTFTITDNTPSNQPTTTTP